MGTFSYVRCGVLQPFYGGKLHRVTADVTNAQGKSVCKVTGEWNSSYEFSMTTVSELHILYIYIFCDVAFTIAERIQFSDLKGLQEKILT